MNSPLPTPPPREDIITPIRPRAARSEPPDARPTGRTFKRLLALVLACTALTAGSLWWIHRVARTPQPAAGPAAPPGAPPPPAAAETAPEPIAPQTAAAPAPEPAAETAAPVPDFDRETSDALSRRLSSAVRNESAGDLQAALGDFQEALRLEPGSTEAQAGRQRVASRLAEDEFRKRMAAGLLALNAGNFEAARESLLKAKALRPASREVAEALSQAEAGERTERIEALRRKALDAEEHESWPEALAAYEAALAIDPRMQFALQGRERSSLRAALSTGIGRFTGQPELLGTDAHLETAARLLDEARSLQPRGPRLEEQIRKLDELVVIARTPIPVTIESDNLTDVAVYRVGKLGRFTVRELRLRPGTYTVAGARDGYRDERRELVVAPGPQPIRITIVCSTKV